MPRGNRDWKPAGMEYHKTPEMEEDERRWREAHQPGRATQEGEREQPAEPAQQ